MFGELDGSLANCDGTDLLFQGARKLIPMRLDCLGPVSISLQRGTRVRDPSMAVIDAKVLLALHTLRPLLQVGYFLENSRDVHSGLNGEVSLGILQSSLRKR